MPKERKTKNNARKGISLKKYTREDFNKAPLQAVSSQQAQTDHLKKNVRLKIKLKDLFSALPFDPKTK